MGKLIDITGNRYGFLEVTGFSHLGERQRSYWKCICTNCGREVTLRKDSFAYPYSTVISCGCRRIEGGRERAARIRDLQTGRFTKAKGKQR